MDNNRIDLTKEKKCVRPINIPVSFLTEPAKKEVIEALKVLEVAKRKLQALLK